MESDRGMALVGVAWIDDKLAQTLLAFFSEGKASHSLVQGGDSPLGTFSSRIKCCRALCLIDDDEYHEIDLLRKIRNEFAHAKQGLSFRSQPISSYCTSLKSRAPDSESPLVKVPRFRFKNAVMALAARLLHRPAWVKEDRRVLKDWAPVANGVWYATADVLPQEGERVIAYNGTTGRIGIAVSRGGRLEFE